MRNGDFGVKLARFLKETPFSGCLGVPLPKRSGAPERPQACLKAVTRPPLFFLAFPAIHAIIPHMLTKQKKQNVIKDVAQHDADTGSAAVQAGLLTRKINELASHLKKNPKDKHSRRGLLKMVSDRRSHLSYLEKKNKRGYTALLKKLGLKK